MAPRVDSVDSRISSIYYDKNYQSDTKTEIMLENKGNRSISAYKGNGYINKITRIYSETADSKEPAVILKRVLTPLKEDEFKLGTSEVTLQVGPCALEAYPKKQGTTLEGFICHLYARARGFDTCKFWYDNFEKFKQDTGMIEFLKAEFRKALKKSI